VPATDDPNRAQRDTLYDIGFRALADGHLDLAEQAFAQAAALPGDPASAAVAASFAERARRLRRTRATAVARAERFGPEPPAGAEHPGEAPTTVLLVTSTVLGLGAYGWALPLALGIDSGEHTRAFVGVYLLTASASFAVPYLALRGDEVTPAQANLAFYGGTRGLWHGLFIAAALAGDVSSSTQERLWAASLVLGSAGEMTLGHLFAGAAELEAGDARTIAVAGDFGLGWGLAAGAILGFPHGDHSSDTQARGMALSGLVGSIGGLGAGYALSLRRNNTWGDGEVWRASGLLGTWLGLTANVLLDWGPNADQDQKKFFSTLIVGGALGLAVGDRLVRRTNFTVGQSLIVDISTLAGALSFAGFGYLAFAGSNSNDPTKPVLIATSVGGLVGFGTAYWWYGGGGKARSAGSGGGSGGARVASVALLPTFDGTGQRGLALAGAF
jgi:hypothetical protein